MSIVSSAAACRLSAVALSLAAVSAGPALAAELFSTGKGADSCIWDCASLYAGQSPAGRFTLAKDATITGIEGWVAGGQTEDIGITLWSDRDGLPFQSLYDGSFTLSVTNATYYASGWAGLSGLSWAVGAGTYWVGFTNGNPGNGAPAMSMAIPNPTSAYARAGGGYGFSAWDKAVGFRVFGEDAGAAGVPEPATWAMMILGFGAIGAASRRRRKGRVRSA